MSRSTSRRVVNGEVPLDMTPMIDIVFQLLTFFVMTFRIAQVEGNFDISLPSHTGQGRLPDSPPLKVTLTADANGDVARIRFGERDYSNFRELHRAVIAVVGPDRGPGSVQSAAEVELDCDRRLHYEHVIAAITAVSGEVGPRGETIRLIEKVRFAPPRGE